MELFGLGFLMMLAGVLLFNSGLFFTLNVLQGKKSNKPFVILTIATLLFTYCFHNNPFVSNIVQAPF